MTISATVAVVIIGFRRSSFTCLNKVRPELAHLVSTQSQKRRILCVIINTVSA